MIHLFVLSKESRTLHIGNQIAPVSHDAVYGSWTSCESTQPTKREHKFEIMGRLDHSTYEENSKTNDNVR